MSLRSFPQDKANHYAYGSWVATTAAAVVLCAAALLQVPQPAWRAALAAMLAAYAIGAWKERQDAKANAAAIAQGKPLPHEASAADRNATALGAVPVAVPLLLVQLTQLL